MIDTCTSGFYSLHMVAVLLDSSQEDKFLMIQISVSTPFQVTLCNYCQKCLIS